MPGIGNSLQSWIMAARPKTLPAAIIPVWVGNVPVLFSDAEFSWVLFFATLLSCLFIQIATNFFNDAIDFTKGADTEKRLGPVRVTAGGQLSQRAVIVAALGCCLLASFVALPLIAARGPVIVGIGVVSLFFSYGYTGGPVPLAYKGLGELFVMLFFGLIAVVGSFWVQTGEWPPPYPIWLLAVQTGLFSCVLIAINNLRDIAEDSQTGKRTLAVRFGKKFARCEIALFFLTAIIIGFVLAQQFQSIAGLIGFAVLFVFCGLISYGIFKNEPGRIYNRYLALSGLMLILYGILITLIFWLK